MPREPGAVHFVDEIIAAEPDVVLVYAGHNEYLGLLGVGSSLCGTRSRSVARLQLWLRHLRLYQLVRDAVSLARVAVGGAARNEADRNTLFSRAASGARIPFGSPLYRLGLEQFEANLGELLEKYERASIPVYIGTLVSNEKDLRPFVGGPSPEVDSTQWARLESEARSSRRSGDIDAARRSLRALLALDENAADVWYALGQLERQAGDARAAREALDEARDRDALRFRAPGAFNRVIREQASRHGARVVEVEERFVKASSDGLLGHELLLEHVHPNADGYFLLTDAFYEVLREDRRIGEGSEVPTRAEARRDMPLTEVDRLLADYAVRELEAGYPFSDPPQTFELPPPRSEVERLAQRLRAGEIEWIDCMEALLQHYRRLGRPEDAARVGPGLPLATTRWIAARTPPARNGEARAGSSLPRTQPACSARRRTESASAAADRPRARRRAASRATSRVARSGGAGRGEATGFGRAGRTLSRVACEGRSRGMGWWLRLVSCLDNLSGGGMLLPMRGLNATSPVPLYRQLADLLLGRIHSGEYATGDRIPSEPELVRRFGIGRPTVRQATELLIRRGRLERRRGSGTFVVAPPEEVDLFSLAGTLAAFREKGIAVRSTLLQRPRRIAVGDQPENPFSGREACFLARRSRVGRESVLLEEIYLDLDHFPGIDRIALAGRSLARWIDEHYHLRPESADQNFRVVCLDAGRAGALGVAPGESALLVRRHLHFGEARNAIFSELYCRTTERLVFSQRLVAEPNPGALHA